jgi:hypothetical protein
MRMLDAAGKPANYPSGKYRWVKSAGELIAVESDISESDANEPGGVQLESPSEIVKFSADYEKFFRSVDVNLLFKKGIVSGLVLLACFVFQKGAVRRYGDGKIGAEKAAKKMLGIGLTSVRSYFKDFGGVAHLWASYLSLFSLLSDSVVETEFLNEIEKYVALDFLSGIDVSMMLTRAGKFLDFGKCEINTGTTILRDVDIIKFDWPDSPGESVEVVPNDVAELIERFRPASKFRG